MYKIDSEKKTLMALQARTFSDLNFRERFDLQEWLVDSPHALGEDLLIIQKEYAGFDFTNERLDLLALDKDGQMVVIENKTDDSGQDVVWQSLKYAAYCSTLGKSKILEIYQQYLNSLSGDKNAAEEIANFLDEDDFDAIQLNQDDDPRIIMVAREFRPEVIATSLWLLNKTLKLKCIKVSLHQNEASEVYASFDQIIPLPEASDYLVRVSGKKAEVVHDGTASRGMALTIALRRDFWTALLAHFRQNHLSLYSNINPNSDHWLNCGSGVGGVNYSLIFAKNSLRTDIWISASDQERNKQVFDYLYKRKENIEEVFGDGLDWKRLNHRKSSRIQYTRDFQSSHRENWPEGIAWMESNILKLEQAFKPYLNELRNI